jgi:hypothetical protein
MREMSVWLYIHMLIIGCSKQAMLEVHDRMHKLWKQQRRTVRELDEQKSNLKSVSSTLPLTLEKAASEWQAEEEFWEKDHQSNLSVLYAVADELFGDGAENGGGASLLCFDEVQVILVSFSVCRPPRETL